MRILPANVIGALVISASASVLAETAGADVPRVASDIAPVASLVARVMEGIDGAEPVGQIVRTGASPHGYAMRPSEAASLEQADAVFWIGPELTPWLEEAIGTLAPEAAVTALLGADGTDVMEFREGPMFHDHGHGEHAHDNDEHAGHDHDEDKHDSEEHAGHDHGDEHEHEDDGHSGDDHAHDAHGHDHSGADPHAWLDPDNASLWLGVIAAELARLDPDNAEAYKANAAAGQDEIAKAEAEVRKQIEPISDARFVVFHDAYHYFEHHFGLPAAGAIADGDASDPGPARIEAVQDMIRDLEVTCVLSEPAFNPVFVQTVIEGTPARSGEIDPLGGEIAAGPDFYPALLRDVATRLVSCAGSQE